MGVKFFLRSNADEDHFKNIFLNLVGDSEIDQLIFICPYWGEGYDGGDFSILDEMKEKLVERDNLKIITVASSGDKKWEESYKNFINNLQTFIEFTSKNISHEAYTLKKKKGPRALHAKLVIGLKQIETGVYTPVVLLLGSSNFTGPVFSDEYYNLESDAVFWIDSHYILKYDDHKYYQEDDLEESKCIHELTTTIIPDYYENYIYFKEYTTPSAAYELPEIYTYNHDNECSEDMISTESIEIMKHIFQVYYRYKKILDTMCTKTN